MSSLSRSTPSRMGPGAGDAQRARDGLSGRGGSHGGGRGGGIGDRNRDMRIDRRMVRRDATVCGPSSLDVAVLSLVMLGRRAQADRRIGDGRGGHRRVGRSPGDLGELARATPGFRATRVEKGEIRARQARPAERHGGGRRRSIEIQAIPSLAVTIAADRNEARTRYHSSAEMGSLPEIDINAPRTLAGVLAFRNLTLPSTKHAFIPPE